MNTSAVFPTNEEGNGDWKKFRILEFVNLNLNLSMWTWTWAACEFPKTFNLRTWVSEPPQNLKTQSLEPQPQILPRKVDSSAKDPG